LCRGSLVHGRDIGIDVEPVMPLISRLKITSSNQAKENFHFEEAP